MKKLRRYRFHIFFIVCGLGMLIGYVRIKKLENNFARGEGYINDLQTSPEGGGVFVEYIFDVDNNSIKRRNSIPHSGSFPSRTFAFLIGKRLPVVYENGHPGNSEMLFRKKDIDKYHIEITWESKSLINRIDSIINAGD